MCVCGRGERGNGLGGKNFLLNFSTMVTLHRLIVKAGGKS